MQFSQYMASRNVRIARILAGLVLVVIGLFVVFPPGYVMAAVGLASLAAGSFARYDFAPLMGMHLPDKAAALAPSNLEDELSIQAGHTCPQPSNTPLSPAMRLR